MTTGTRHNHPLPETYDELIRIFPLRPVHDEVDLENAREIMDGLAVLDALTDDQSDYLHVLANLVEEYEELRSTTVPRLGPIEALKYLMDEHGMSASDLGRVLGQRQLGSAILRGARKLSKAHVQALAKRFSVRADLFLG
jgi:HTH-type transcriptional regulator/antitoxin HigA